MPNGNTVKHGWILLCMCTPLYNETLRGCFTVGEKKKYQKIDDEWRACDRMENREKLKGCSCGEYLL